tara:strand:+ start:21617 stop:22948 length:1332 start_codon:yes stop_codon:yes gene_type:complete
MKKRFFPFLIGLSALLVSGSAAFYSVFGLSKLFAGAATQVLIMAGSLEFAKLVCASLLYQYWDTINKWLRFYLSIAVFVLMVITSGGIYGFLSGAYQETATKSEFLDKSLAVLETKQGRFEEQKNDLTIEKTQLNTTISDLRTSLSNPTSVSYWDENSQSVITTTSSSTRRALQKELETTIVDRNNVNLKLEAVMDSVMRIDTELLDLEINNEEQRELGPLKYLSETTGKDMGQVVNWFLLLIIFVFDPLAIAMVVAANFAFAQIRPKKDKVPSPHYSPQPILPKEEPIYTEEDEKRMDIIGQNGNDGIHYEEKKEIQVTEPIPLKKLDDEKKDKDYITSIDTYPLEWDENNDTKKTEPTPIKPTTDELNKLEEVLTNLSKKTNIGKTKEDLATLTDTTQTLIVANDDNKNDSEDKTQDELYMESSDDRNVKRKRTLRYRKRK